MPIEIAPVTRRSFLAHAVVATGGFVSAGHLPAGESEGVETVALCSDTHIAADPRTVRAEVNMSTNLREALRQIVNSPDKPARVLINGDCAYINGQPDDYQTFLTHLSPVREAGLRVTLLLGNHDDREPLQKALKEVGIDASPVPHKQVAIVRTKHVNWFLLDSLDMVNSTPGLLGKAQLDWLDGALRENAGKPAFVMAHHNVDHRKHLKSGEVIVDVVDRRLPAPGLIDDEPLLEILTAHPNVASYFCGHTHQWNVVRWKGISFVNLPCTAYPFLVADPVGWVICRLGADKTEIELRTLDEKHRSHGQKVVLPYQGA